MSHTNALDNLIRMVGDFEPGTVSLVGAGPGDGALISVRGAVRLGQAEVILHDESIGSAVLNVVGTDAEHKLIGQYQNSHLQTQGEIYAALVRQARKGKCVVLLTGSDPFFFGRGGEVCEYLASAGVPFEVVPAVPAALGASATAGIPLTHSGSSQVLFVNHDESADVHNLDFELLAMAETVVILTVTKNLEKICQQLIDAGMDVRTPAAVIDRSTCPDQKTIVGTVGDIHDRVADEDIGPRAIFLIGQVVHLRESIEWFEQRPLHGQTIAVTRSRDQSASLSGPLLAAGAEVIEAPTLAIIEPENYQDVDQALNNLSQYDWLVMTSSNGVEALYKRLEFLGLDGRALAGIKIAAVGWATAAKLADKGIRADLVPAEAVAESLVQELISQNVEGKGVLMLRADIARQYLPKALLQAGADCDDLTIYRTACPTTLPDLFLELYDKDRIDWITLTSPSSFVNLLTLLGKNRVESLGSIKLASIGPVTTRAIRDAGYIETVEADPHDVQGLVAAIKSAHKKR
ncbi:MAG: uroporphyrinogen-III C-methyltransferase [Planctomycetota bacterium]|nr:MAG: uroporphyrinogen-III C-methyltransferase [Planctomycetota bacterium]